MKLATWVSHSLSERDKLQLSSIGAGLLARHKDIREYKCISLPHHQRRWKIEFVNMNHQKQWLRPNKKKRFSDLCKNFIHKKRCCVYGGIVKLSFFINRLQTTSFNKCTNLPKQIMKFVNMIKSKRLIKKSLLFLMIKY